MVSKLRERIEAQLAYQVQLRTQELWKMQNIKNKLPFITISREYGCHGYPVALALQDKLNELTAKEFPWAAFDREVIQKIAEEHHISESLALSLGENQRSQMQQYMDHIFFNRPNEYKIFQYLTQTIIGLAETGHVILIGRGSCIITRNIKNGFHVRLIAPFEFRKEKIKTEKGLSEDDAIKLIKRLDKEREAFVKKYTLKEISDPCNFNLIFNNAFYSPDEIAETIIHNLKIKNYI